MAYCIIMIKTLYAAAIDIFVALALDNSIVYHHECYAFKAL